MRRVQLSKVLFSTATICLLYLTWTQPAFADAKAVLSIAASGTCATGATAFAIINKNSNNGIQATVLQTTVLSGKSTSSTFAISLGPGEQKALGCSPQDSAGNFQVTWQIQSAQYQ